MALKLKEKKKDNPKIQFGVAMMLSRLVPTFRTPTYADMLTVEAIVKNLEEVEKQQQQHTSTLFERLAIPGTDVVDRSHPQYSELTKEIMTGTGKVTREDLSCLTSDQFNHLAEGMHISYSERKQLYYWLVKE